MLVLIGLILSKIKLIYDSPERVLSPTHFPLKQRILVNEHLIKEGDDPDLDITPQQIVEALPMYEEAFEVTYKDYNYILEKENQKNTAVLE